MNHRILTAAVIATVITALLWLWGQGTPPKHVQRSRGKRWVGEEHASSLHHDEWNMTHVYLTNSWYRYAQSTARAKDRKDCYVCSHMPASSLQPTVYVKKIIRKLSICIAQKAGKGHSSDYAINERIG